MAAFFLLTPCTPPAPIAAMKSALLLACLAPCMAIASDLAGRWEGTAEIPGNPQRIVVDVARDGSAWRGSVVLPGRSVKGAALRDVKPEGAGLRASLAGAFPGARPAPELVLVRRGDDTLGGELRMAGHSAPLALQRSGPPQVDSEPARTAVSAELAGTWVGRYELGGVPRDVTLKVANGAQGPASGELRVVGRRETTLAVDRVVQGREFVSFEATAADFRIEGRWATPDGTIQGQVLYGPFEAPIVLRRQARSAS